MIRLGIPELLIVICMMVLSLVVVVYPAIELFGESYGTLIS